MPVFICREQTINEHGRCTDQRVTYTGAVLGLIERNGYDDSDFDAIVWDAEQGCVRTVNYASTRGWTYHNSARIDATPEVIEAARAWMRAWWTRLLTKQAEQAARRPEMGRVVRSLAKRGKTAGVEGKIVWAGVNQYRSRWRLTVRRFGVETPDGLVFMDEDRVEVVAPEPVDIAEIAEIAADRDMDFSAVVYPPITL